MNNLEDRLRDAYREAAGTVHPEAIRGLHEHRVRPEPQLRGTRSRRGPSGSGPSGSGGVPRGGTALRGRALAPLVAAAAVVAVAVTASLLVPRVFSAHSPAAASGSRAKSSVPAAAAAGGLPKFIVEGTSGGLKVLDTTTWTTVAEVPAPSGQAFTTVAGAADDRTFVVAADLRVQTSCGAWLYELHLSSQGQPGSLSVLAPEMSGLPTALALSADAETVAYSVVHCASGATGHTGASQAIGNIGVIKVATRQVTQWSFTLAEDYTNDLSLSADGSLLGFSSFLDSQLANPLSVGRVLPTDRQPGTVAQRGQVLVQPAQAAYTGTDGVALSTDGHTMYACTHTSSAAADIPQTLAAYDTSTGQLTKVLRTSHPQDLTCNLTANPAGGYLLMATTAVAKAPRGQASQFSRSPASSRAKLRAKGSATVALSWINLATGGVATLPVSFPVGAVLGL